MAAIYETQEKYEFNANQMQRLQYKVNFASLNGDNKKPSVEAEGLERKSSGLPSKLNGNDTSSVIADAPILYKQEGAQMSKIPYFFDTPVPKYFRELGWFKNENTFKFVNWAFSRCSNQSRKIVMNGKEFILQPYEFIAGRLTSPSECFLTENKFRNQLNSMINAGLLKKSTNKITNHFTCYTWVIEAFSENNNQQNNQPTTNRPPTDHHNLEDKKIRRLEKDHPSIPSGSQDSDGLIDDLFFKEEEKIHVALNCYLTKNEYDDCIKHRGSKELVESIVVQVSNWPGRKFQIKDWAKTIKEWNFKNQVAEKISKNEINGKKIEELYGDSDGWRAKVWRHTIKDQRGVLFECMTGAHSEPVFIPFSEENFLEKCKEIIRTKKMKMKKKN